MPKKLFHNAVEILRRRPVMRIFPLSRLTKKDPRRKSRKCKKMYYSAY
jgi:hypothetical protein